MDELELFKKKAVSYIEKALAGGVSLLSFLDEAKVSILEELLKKYNVSSYKYGGIINSDRVRYIISSYDVIESDFNIVVYKYKS